MANQKGDILVRDSNNYLTNINVGSGDNVFLVADTSEDLGVRWEDRGTIVVENDCINGTFDMWQRGTSFSTNGVYTADRFYVLDDGTFTISKHTLTVDELPGITNAMSISHTTTGLSSSYGNIVIRLLDVRRYSGKRVQVRFKVYTGDTGKKLVINGVQNFGSGGSSNANASPYKFGVIPNGSWYQATGYLNFPSISGKTIGDLSYSQINIWYDAGTNYANFDLGSQSFSGYITDIEIYAADSILPTRKRTQCETMELCERYFQKSYEVDVTPGTLGDGLQITNLMASARTSFYTVQKLSRRMIQAPVVTFYPSSGTGTAGYVYSESASGIITASATDPSEISYANNIGLGGAISPGDSILFNYTADAEI